MESRTDHVMTRFSSPGSPGPREYREQQVSIHGYIHGSFTLHHTLYTTVLDNIVYTHSVSQYQVIYSIPTLYHSIRSNTPCHIMRAQTPYPLYTTLLIIIYSTMGSYSMNNEKQLYYVLCTMYYVLCIMYYVLCTIQAYFNY